jgi:hypothetical protein
MSIFMGKAAEDREGKWQRRRSGSELGMYEEAKDMQAQRQREGLAYTKSLR